MAERSPKLIPVSEHLFKLYDDALFQPPSRVSENFYLSDAVLRAIYSLGESPTDFLINAGHLYDAAVDKVSAEKAEPVCRKGGDCGACLGGSQSNRRNFFRPQSEDFPEVDMSIGVSCSKAMVRRGDPNLMGLTSVNLERYVGASGRDPEYDGVRVFDSGCHIEMVGQVVLTSEFLAEELGL